MTNFFEYFLVPALLAALIALATLVVIAALYRRFRRPVVRTMCFLLLFCFGVVLYYRTDIAQSPQRGARVVEVNNAEKFVNAMNNAISIFFPSRGEYSDIKKLVCVNGLCDHRLLWAFLILHYLVYCYFAAIVFSFFGARTADRLWSLWFFSIMPRVSSVNGFQWLKWEKMLKHKFVFWGVSEESEALADSLCKDKASRGRCLFVLSRELWHEKERYAAVADRLTSRGHHVVWEDLESNGTWYESAGRHFFLGSNEQENAKLAALLVGAAVKKGILTLDVYVRGRTPKEIEGINIHHIDNADNTARYLLNKYPLESCRGVSVNAKTLSLKGTCRTLIVGFGEVGQAVLKQHLMRYAFPGLALKTAVVGGNKDELEVFKALHPDLFTNGAAGELSLYNIATSSAEFLDWVGERKSDFDRIVICPDDGIDCIVLAERIVRMIGRVTGSCDVEIFAYDTYNESTKRRSKVKTFGKIRDIYTRELVVDGLRMKHLPEAMMAEMSDQETIALRKTFCHNATDRMLDLIRIAGFNTIKRKSTLDEATPSAANEFLSGVESNLVSVVAAFKAARCAFMAWKGFPQDKYAESDEQFARGFFKIFKLAETEVEKQEC